MGVRLRLEVIVYLPRADQELMIPVRLPLAQFMFCHWANGQWQRQCHASIVVVNTLSVVKQHRSWLNAALAEHNMLRAES